MERHEGEAFVSLVWCVSGFVLICSSFVLFLSQMKLIIALVVFALLLIIISEFAQIQLNNLRLKFVHLQKQHFLSQFSSCDPPISLMSNEEDGERIFHFFLFFLCPFFHSYKGAHASIHLASICPWFRSYHWYVHTILLQDQHEGWV